MISTTESKARTPYVSHLALDDLGYIAPSDSNHTGHYVGACHPANCAVVLLKVEVLNQSNVSCFLLHPEEG